MKIRKRLSATAFLLLFGFALLCSAGCGGDGAGDAAIRAANRTNIQRLTNLYSRHQIAKCGKVPASEQEFRQFISGLDQQTLKNVGIDPGKLDDLFKSERDQQPFEIRYGVAGSTRCSNEAIIFEQQGKDGQREVGFTSLAIRQVNDADLAALKSGKSAEPAGSSKLPPGAGR